MIHSIAANHESFHAVEFTTGLNVILAERSVAATEKDTRNGLGKSTLIEIIDFCLGSRATNGKGLLIDALKDWAFTVDLTLAGNRVKVTRAVSDPQRVVIDGPTTGWIEQPEKDDLLSQSVFKMDRWRILLGWALFDLHPLSGKQSYRPSYRSLISYFIRRRPDAYVSPFRHFRQQHTWDMQLHIAYLLGMNWEYASRWQILKEKADAIQAVQKAIKTGAMDGAIGSIGELETEVIQLEQETRVTRDALNDFRVHPQYEALQRDADRLTGEVHEVANQNVADRRRLTRYRESIKDEKPPRAMSLEKIYEECGVVFPEFVRRSLGEAKAFHNQVISNRREFLNAEIAHLRKTIQDRDGKIRDLTKERADILQVLQTFGALQEMTSLQERFIGLQESLERAQSRLKEMREFNTAKREIKKAREDLFRLAEQDHGDRREIWSEAVRLFNEYSQVLYETAGTLVIDISDKGYKYRVDIERSGSEGIEKMKIFCFDLMALRLRIKAGQGIGFLIHDTLMYDSVDSRQRAMALEHAHRMTSRADGQYICAMNSDMVPSKDFTEGFDFDRHVRLTLSDATPEGSLLGFRFEASSQ